jgi:hypothetical protein
MLKIEVNASVHSDDTVSAVTNAARRKILFLGNSITFVPSVPEIGWNNNCGMAASSLEKDYVHLLLKWFTAESGGKTPDARIENIADFEREYATLDLAQFDQLADFMADTLILAIGENVPVLVTVQDQAQFHVSVSELLTRVSRQGKPVIYIRSTFWPDPVKDAILRQVCDDMGGTFVGISHLATDEKNYARSEREISHAGVAAHPGDAGMAAIAEAIWNAILAKGSDSIKSLGSNIHRTALVKDDLTPS